MADARGENWYLDSSVDPTKITVPELRSILLKHGVQYPSSAKKPVLLDLFKQQVLPQAAQLQRSHARIKPSTRGIEDVPSSASTTTTDDNDDDDDDDDTALAPPPTVTRRTSRRTMRASTVEDNDRAAPPPRSKTPTRAIPTKHARGSDVEPDERPAVRRNRKSAVTPVAKQLDAPEDDSPFTQDNPFQKGSSPPDPAARERRRRTLGFEHKEKRKSDAFRRKTMHPSSEQHGAAVVVPSRSSFDVPARRLPKQALDYSTEPDSVDAGEEFAPEAQLELVRDRARAGEVDILPPRRRRRHSKASGTIKAFSATLLVTSLAVFGGVWRQEKFSVGYCGIGRESTSLAGVDVPEWASVLLPQCEPCPPHAICYSNLEVQCDRDFMRRNHPLSLGGLIPLPPTCEPDSEKTRRITLVADRGVQVLRKRKAAYECREPDKEGKLVETPEIGEGELKQEMSSMKRKGMTQEEFEDLWQSAIGDMVSREEIVDKSDGTTSERRLASNSLAELSLSCSIRRSLRQTLERYIWQLVLIVSVLVSGSYGRYRLTSGRATEARAKQLASSVFDRLANHAALNAQDPSYYPDPGISMAQLRDDVLRTEFSASKRQQLWKRVQDKVEHNANVRAAVREDRSGDVTRMWEWIGPVQLLEDGRSGGSRHETNRERSRDSGRFSLGPAFGSSPPEMPSRDTKQPKALDSSAWPEGRPIY